MRNWIVTIAFTLPTLLLFPVGTPALKMGSIHGVVVDEIGIPVSKAAVSARIINGHILSTLIRYVETDTDGQFSLDRLEWGAYRVYANKEDSGYPDTSFSFYNKGFPTTATLTPQAPIAEVRIQFGPKAGILTGMVTDALSGAPINAGFKLIRTGSPDDWISTALLARYRVLVPPSTDITLEVSAHGYKTWYSGGSSDPLRSVPLCLESGVEMRLDIQLQPEDSSGINAVPGLTARPPVSAKGVRPTMPPAQNEGSIRGTVVDENGILLSGAKVFFEPTDHHQRHSSVSTVETDATGRFVIDYLDWGQYQLYARKEDAGYPNTVFPIYSNGIQTRAEITSQAPKAEVEMRIGPKAGVLAGVVTDANTGKPVVADFLIKRVASPDESVSLRSSNQSRRTGKAALQQ